MVRDDIQRISAALLTPRADYVARLANARDSLSTRSVEGARQLTVFLDRISDLSVEELRELHGETFSGRWSAELASTARRLAAHSVTARDAGKALSVLTPALSRLDACRNPFAYVVRALCCLLIVRAASGSCYQPVNSPPSNQSHNR